jgi:hypothetical protein
MLARTFVVVTTATQRRADTTHATLIALTVNEFRRLCDALVLRPPHTSPTSGMVAMARRHQGRA